MIWLLWVGCHASGVPEEAAAPPDPPPPAELDEGDVPVDPGVRIGRTGPYDGATRATLAPACAGGDFEACFHLGQSWHFGAEGWRNVQKARFFYQLACENGLADGCLAVERADWMGWGSADDTINVVGELVESCERGASKTCWQLAMVLGEADLEPEVAAAVGMAPLGSVTSAAEIVGRACARGNQQACDQVRLLALHRDPAVLRRHNGVLCTYEGSSTCEAYADACAAGVGGPVDHVEAQRVYAQLCRPWSAPVPPPPIMPPPPPLPPDATPEEITRHRHLTWRAAESVRRQPPPVTEEDRRRDEEIARSCERAAALTPDPLVAAELRTRACEHRTRAPCEAR